MMRTWAFGLGVYMPGWEDESQAAPEPPYGPPPDFVCRPSIATCLIFY
jgi:hypothetical protein